MRHKKKALYPLLAVALLMLTLSCNKRCQCYRYDGGYVEYSTDDLETLGKTCSEMIYYEGLATQRYSMCEWKY